ncbi:hypothetical protein PCASD_08547 [Puccinia coronata f. sp. avenae]|uniref:Calcineurin-like phosphoesterase domain-containing protein n=1 Tax=Puccinia coronata f. sp. avenae TaxID=200324 RepID=A0A2N5UR90_9BASI|nr:hypothetical protein PCASD_08547 [Puccinia coronata f. sp. avenae]
MLRTSSSNSRKDSSFLSLSRSSSSLPLPGYHQQRPKKAFRNTSRFISATNSSRKIKIVIGVLLLLLCIHWAFNTLLILFRFKIADSLLSSGWIGLGLKIRKPPLVYIHSSHSAAIVWESNKMATSSGHQLGLRYWEIGQGYKNQSISLSSRQENHLKLLTGKLADIKRTRPEGSNGWRRWVHSTTIEGLKPLTTYEYEIVLLDNHFAAQQNQFNSIKKIYSKHRFTWHTIDPLHLHNGQRLSETSATSASPSNFIHVAIIGDNQFGVKPFRKIMKRLLNMKSYLPSSTNSVFSPRQISHNHPVPIPTKPDMIFHLGDAVQDAHNLKQWQTDFWDPITYKHQIASEIPILYTKGNHDFDTTGHNVYSGGIPKVQVGEMNRTQTRKLNSNSPLEIPGIAEADKSYTSFTTHERDPQSSRGTYYAYSPHPRVRVIVCDSNLETGRLVSPESTLSEVDEHERWLLWEMARPEWKEASIRIILIHIPPFIEFWEKLMWTHGHESAWGSYVRTRFAPHFHGLSGMTQRYDIPPASLVISGHSHMYARGMLSTFIADDYFRPDSSARIPVEVKKTARSQNRHEYDPVTPHLDNGVVYVISGGAGGTLDSERVEEWGFYERTVTKEYHFNHMLLDMSRTLSSHEEWKQDWEDSRSKRAAFKEKKVRVYKLIGSQLVCQGPVDSTSPDGKTHQVWNAGHYSATDRLVWSTRSADGRLLDRFIIEADSCR